MTTGQIMFYGGIIGTVIMIALMFILWGVFEKKKNGLRKQIEDEY